MIGEQSMKKRIDQYDSIRTWCTLLIIIGHLDVYITQYAIGNATPLFNLWGYANGSILGIAVSAFFILSGASLMCSYGTRDFSLKEYVIKRFYSIYPMFYVAWIVFYFIYFFAGNTIRAEMWKIIFTILGIDGYLTFVMDNFYLIGEWFLAVIIILYVIFPILLWIRKKSVLALVVLAILSYVIGCYLQNVGVNSYAFPMTRVLEFVFGMLFTEYYKIISQKAKALIGIGASIIFVILLFVKFDVFYMHTVTLMGMAAYIVFFMISTVLCKISIYKNVCIEFSKISYPVYLVHHQILGFIAQNFFYTNIGREEVYIMFFAALSIIIISGYILKWFTENLVRKIKIMMQKE